MYGKASILSDNQRFGGKEVWISRQLQMGFHIVVPGIHADTVVIMIPPAGHRHVDSMP